MNIIIMLCLFAIILLVNVTITLGEKQFTYCYMIKGETECNAIDMSNRQYSEIDDYLDAYINDRVERSYEIKK